VRDDGDIAERHAVIVAAEAPDSELRHSSALNLRSGRPRRGLDSSGGCNECGRV
jgi:hypothetical protein